MAESIKMPALGESVTEGTVSMWLKNVGDTVTADEPIVEVATDKVDSEVPSPVSGVLLEILVDEDETVEVGTPIAVVGEAGEAPQAAPAAEVTPAAAPAAPASPASAATPASPSSSPQPSVPAATEAPAPVGGGDLVDVTMPALGESVTEGTVSMWLKQVGDEINVDDPIVEVATDKVDSEVPSPVAGFLQEIVVDEDETVEVGAVIARISSQSPSTAEAPQPAIAVAAATPAPPAAPAAPSAAPVPPTAPPAAPVAPPAAPVAPTAPPAAPVAPPAAPATPAAVPSGAHAVPAAEALPAAAGYVTPIVRKMAREQGIDLSKVSGTGVGGRIRKEDLLAAAAAATTAAETQVAPEVSASTGGPVGKPVVSDEAAALRGTTQRMTRLRQVVASRMLDSLQGAAQLTTVFEVDVTNIWNLRSKYKDKFEDVHGTRLTFLPFFVKAATEALAAHPVMNAVTDNKEIVYHDQENIGIAVDTERGLMVPVIKNAGDMSIAQIAESINTLAAKVRDGNIGPDELTGSTFTITNTGSGGALFDTPILNSPEVGILGVGTIVKRPVVVKDQEGGDSIAVRSMVYLAITYDHQLVDGADAARFLTSMKNRLQAGDFYNELQLG